MSERPEFLIPAIAEFRSEQVGVLPHISGALLLLLVVVVVSIIVIVGDSRNIHTLVRIHVCSLPKWALKSPLIPNHLFRL